MSAVPNLVAELACWQRLLQVANEAVMSSVASLVECSMRVAAVVAILPASRGAPILATFVGWQTLKVLVFIVETSSGLCQQLGGLEDSAVLPNLPKLRRACEAIAAVCTAAEGAFSRRNLPERPYCDLMSGMLSLLDLAMAHLSEDNKRKPLRHVVVQRMVATCVESIVSLIDIHGVCPQSQLLISKVLEQLCTRLSAKGGTGLNTWLPCIQHLFVIQAALLRSDPELRSTRSWRVSHLKSFSDLFKKVPARHRAALKPLQQDLEPVTAAIPEGRLLTRICSLRICSCYPTPMTMVVAARAAEIAAGELLAAEDLVSSLPTLSKKKRRQKTAAMASIIGQWITPPPTKGQVPLRGPQ